MTAQEVLPLTREWIEISQLRRWHGGRRWFSLLRGSGLKYLGYRYHQTRCTSSPSYEGVDWNTNYQKARETAERRSPSYEGVDWNNKNHIFKEKLLVLPLTREWIEMFGSLFIFAVVKVLPLTREWIEIPYARYSRPKCRVLPLTREWIEMGYCLVYKRPRHVLPLTREWIEIYRWNSYRCADRVLPLTREWIEIGQQRRNRWAVWGSPSYEGVDWNIDLVPRSHFGVAFSLLRGSGLKWRG